MSRGMLIIISGPSGSGKGTVVNELDPDNNYALSISVTTRQKREHEVDGKDYFFTTMEDFAQQRDQGLLLEHTLFCGHCYGTPRDYVEQKITEGKVVVLEIEVNGALQVKDKFPDAVLIFLMPPTMQEMRERLVKRNTESKDTIEDRMRRATEEIKLIERYDYLVVNDQVADAVSKINIIVKAESLKPHRNKSTINYFKGVESEC